MATLAPDPSPSSSPPFHRRSKSWARRIERCCCTTFAFFPLCVVYGLTSWALWVEYHASFLAGNGIFAYFKAALALIFYGLANTSYAITMFTNPGSPIDARYDAAASRRRRGGDYQGLPLDEREEGRNNDGPPHSGMEMSTVTAKTSTGSVRYCKKCQTQKPDRAHHCSTCGRCVLKMDHHCPWLATCVGLRNYKPFLLFLMYTTLFCWTCFAVTAYWVWMAVIEDKRIGGAPGMLVNTVLLSVLSGVIGLVLGGFTSWHGYLVVTGQTTIECLEKTRYLAPVRKNLAASLAPSQNTYPSSSPHNAQRRDPWSPETEQHQGLLDQLKETHANALPSVLRPEEGESHPATPSPLPTHPNIPNHQPVRDSSSPATSSLQTSYAQLEARREADRYALYLDEKASENLPNAFDLGWRRNVRHVFGDQARFWFLPLRNTSGDGWGWETSAKWWEAREEARREREAAGAAGWDGDGGLAGAGPNEWRWQPGQGFVGGMGPPGGGASGVGAGVQMNALDRRKVEADGDRSSWSSSEDEDRAFPRYQNGGYGQNRAGLVEGARNWNDVPDDLLAPRGGGDGSRSASRGRGRRKGD